MKAVQIGDLKGNYGTIQNQAIWDAVARWGFDMVVVSVMVARFGVMKDDEQAQAPETRDYVLSRGVQFGFMRSPDWTGLNEADFARALNADLDRYGLDGKRHPRWDPCYVVANAESHSFDPIKFIGAWRGSVAKRPTRQTGWAIEGFQGGRISDEAVAVCNADKYLDVMPETYTGDMHPQAADAVKDDLRGRGFQRIKLHYDARLGAPERGDGLCFLLERLPA